MATTTELQNTINGFTQTYDLENVIKIIETSDDEELKEDLIDLLKTIYEAGK